jgi:hypothetical protein
LVKFFLLLEGVCNSCFDFQKFKDERPSASQEELFSLELVSVKSEDYVASNEKGEGNDVKVKLSCLLDIT